MDLFMTLVADRVAGGQRAAQSGCTDGLGSRRPGVGPGALEARPGRLRRGADGPGAAAGAMAFPVRPGAGACVAGTAGLHAVLRQFGGGSLPRLHDDLPVSPGAGPAGSRCQAAGRSEPAAGGARFEGGTGVGGGGGCDARGKRGAPAPACGGDGGRPGRGCGPGDAGDGTPVGGSGCALAAEGQPVFLRHQGMHPNRRGRVCGAGAGTAGERRGSPAPPTGRTWPRPA